MANICSTTLHIKGERQNIINLASDIAALTDDNTKCSWVGEHLKRFGYDADKIQCTEFNLRATLVDYDINDDGLIIDIESAWSPCYHYMTFLADKYDVDVNYIAEESGCGLYLTDMIDSIHPYIILIDKEDFYCCEEDFKTEEERDNFVKKHNLAEEDYDFEEYSEYNDWREKIDYKKLPKIRD